jgi:hypothetical protein
MPKIVIFYTLFLTYENKKTKTSVYAYRTNSCY